MRADRTLIHLFSAHLVNDIYTPVIMAMLPLLMSTYGYSYFLAACLASTHSLASSVLQPIFGWVSDKQGFFVPVSVSILISGIFISVMGLFPGVYPLLIIFVAIAAIGHASFHPAALSIVSDLSTDSNRGIMTSYFVVGGNIGFACGPVIVGFLLAQSGFSGVVFLMIPALLVGVMLRNLSFSRQNQAAHPVDPLPEPLSDHRFDRKNPIIPLFCASIFRSWVIFGSITFFPLYFVANGYTLLMATMLVTGMLFAGVLGQIIGGYLSDRYGRKDYLVITTFLVIPPLVLFLQSSGVIATIAMLLFGFFLWSTFAVTIAMAHEMMPHDIGLTSGLFLGSALGAGGIGVAVSGYIADTWGLIPSIALFGLLLGISGLFYAVTPHPYRTFTIVRKMRE